MTGATIERPAVAVGAVVRRDDCLLMVRRGHGPAAGTWSIPGGHVEWGELCAEAVVREVREETGLAVVCGPLIGWAELVGEGHHHVLLDFEATAIDHSEPRAGSDASEASWVPLIEVCDRDLPDGLAEFLAEHRIIPTIV